VNDPIRRLSVVALTMFLLLMGASSLIQFVHADELSQDQRNVRTLYREYGNFRGPIVVDGIPVAFSVPVDDAFSYQRSYVEGPLYSAVTGFYSVTYGRTGLEQAQNQLLSGNADALFWSRLGDIVAGEEQQGASVELTLSSVLQRVATEQLGSQRGAVVAIDPRTGEILAMVSSPSYDPSLLATHDTTDVIAAYDALIDDPRDPLINRAIGGDTYAPGSVFKLVVAAAAVEQGYRPETLVPAPDILDLPDSSATIQNFEGEQCAADGIATLGDALRTSCNTAFAGLGMELGWEAIAAKARDFGWEDSIDVPLPVTASQLPADPDVPQTALSSLGQFDVRATPFQAAMLAAAIANDGTLMRPYLVEQVRASDLTVIERTEPSVYRESLRPDVAEVLTQMMIASVDSGTGTAARIDGVLVAGKTGTAQAGGGLSPHAWFVGFAPADDPVIAIAVLVENGGAAGDDATGGRVAAPIARAVILEALAREAALVAGEK